MFYLWSYRYSAARGFHWKREREVTAQNALEWLAAFQADEPGIEFKVSARKPKD